MARGSDSFTVWREGEADGAERKIWRGRGWLELGFHNDGSYSLSLGRPDICELETETITLHPPHHGPIDAHWPLLVLKEQGQAERHTDLHPGKGRRLTPSCGEIEDCRLPFEVILSKKEETATQVEATAPAFRRLGLVVRA